MSKVTSSTTITRVLLVVLGAQALLLGGWAAASPRGFYDDFPGFGRHWVSLDGPFNEHLVRDFGALNLALGVFTLCAAIWLTRTLVVAAAIAWLVYSVPHVLYHVFNVDGFDAGDQVGILGGLLLQPVLAVVVLVLAGRTPSPTVVPPTSASPTSTPGARVE